MILAERGRIVRKMKIEEKILKLPKYKKNKMVEEGFTKIDIALSAMGAKWPEFERKIMEWKDELSELEYEIQIVYGTKMKEK